jgi:hypothetical protein
MPSLPVLGCRGPSPGAHLIPWIIPSDGSRPALPPTLPANGARFIAIKTHHNSLRPKSTARPAAVYDPLKMSLAF